jgi:hypothetical protein
VTRPATYPGFCGVLDVGETPLLDGRERLAFRENIADVIAMAAKPEAFFDELVHCVHRLRDLLKLDQERTAVGRRDDLDVALRAIRRGAKRVRLSQVNRINKRLLRAAHPDLSETDLLLQMREDIPRSGSGRPPSDALRYAAVFLNEACSSHLLKQPSSRKDGYFCQLLEAVSLAADGKVQPFLHRAAEEALRIRPAEEGPGVTTFIRERFL